MHKIKIGVIKYNSQLNFINLLQIIHTADIKICKII
jgi:hypothetical protein